MTIDERLEALTMNSELLHATVHEMASTQETINRNFQARFEAFFKWSCGTKND
jgi:hypothetical protein